MPAHEGRAAGVRPLAMTRLRYEPVVLVLILGTLGALGMAAWVAREHTLGAYSTPLRGRTPSQVHNARLAAAAVDGAVIPPGGEFSFIAATGPWTLDRGYRKAPVSFDGELVLSFGGGVCQTSSAVYCAALAAGLDVTERHAHTWAPQYVPPGADAAVAPEGIDLRLRNPLAFPVRILVTVERERLVCRMVGRGRVVQRFEVVRETTDVIPAPQVLRPDPGLAAGASRVLTRGHAGCRVRTLRVVSEGGRVVERELISEDHYPPLSRVVQVGAGSVARGG